jgi:hypothetical protein
MFDLKVYSVFREDNDPAYPNGKAVDTPDGDSVDGTQYDRRFFNQIFGFYQSVIHDAYESPVLSDYPDSVSNPEILEALKIIIRRITDTLLEMILQNQQDIAAEIEARVEQHNNLLNAINNLTIRLAVVENALYSDLITNPFEITFNNLGGIVLISGIWNEPLERIECTLSDDLISINFKTGENFVVIQGVYNTELSRVEC